MMNFREICKTIFFCIVSVNLGVSSGLEILGFVFAGLFIAIHVKQYLLSKKSSALSLELLPAHHNVPRYRKFFALFCANR